MGFGGGGGGGGGRVAVRWGRSVHGRLWRRRRSYGDEQVWVCAASRKSSRGKKSGTVSSADEVLQKCVDTIDEAAKAVDAVATAMDSRVAKLEAKLDELTARLDAREDAERSTVQRDCDSGEVRAPKSVTSNGSMRRQEASSPLSSSSSSSSSSSLSSASASRASTAAANGRTRLGAGPALIAAAVHAANTGTVELIDMSTATTRNSVDNNDIAAADTTMNEDVEDVADTNHERPSHNGLTNEVVRKQEEKDSASPIGVDEASPSRTSSNLPLVSTGSDDIEHVAMLHRLLAAHGFCVSDEEEEDFLFEQSTEEALRTFQVCNGVEETGFVDGATWRALRKAEDESGGEAGQCPRPADAAPEWPALEYGCGGREVHLLQRALAVRLPLAISHLSIYIFISLSISRAYVCVECAYVCVRACETAEKLTYVRIRNLNVDECMQSHGFFSGDDDMQWWEFGDGTLSALKMFQASCRLPPTGTTSAAAWECLLGSAADRGIDAAAALGGPEMAEFERDLASIEGRVYLLGEDRFENVM